VAFGLAAGVVYARGELAAAGWLVLLAARRTSSTAASRERAAW